MQTPLWHSHCSGQYTPCWNAFLLTALPPPGRHPPWADTPRQTPPPLGRPPPSRHPTRQTPHPTRPLQRTVRILLWNSAQQFWNSALDYVLSRLQTLVASVKENHLIFVYTVVLRWIFCTYIIHQYDLLLCCFRKIIKNIGRLPIPIWYIWSPNSEQFSTPFTYCTRLRSPFLQPRNNSWISMAYFHPNKKSCKSCKLRKYRIKIWQFYADLLEKYLTNWHLVANILEHYKHHLHT